MGLHNKEYIGSKMSVDKQGVASSCMQNVKEATRARWSPMHGKLLRFLPMRNNHHGFSPYTTTAEVSSPPGSRCGGQAAAQGACGDQGAHDTLPKCHLQLGQGG